MAQSVKHLLSKHEDPCSGPQHPCKSQAWQCVRVGEPIAGHRAGRMETEFTG